MDAEKVGCGRLKHRRLDSRVAWFVRDAEGAGFGIKHRWRHAVLDILESGPRALSGMPRRLGALWTLRMNRQY